MKRQLELLKQSPIRSFLVAFFIVPLLTVLIALATWTSVPWKAWGLMLETGLWFGALTGLTVHLKKGSPHLGWEVIFGILLQIVVALLFAAIPIAHLFGFLVPQPDATSAWFLLPISATLLLAALGMLRNVWWAYFLEASIMLAIVLLMLSLPAKPQPRAIERYPLESFLDSVGPFFLLALGIYLTLSTGLREWRHSRRRQLGP